MKQTAVEFLSENYRYVTWLTNRDEITASEADKMRSKYFEEAKEMEKEQQGYSEEEVLEIVEQAIKDYNSKQLHLFDGSFSNPIYTNLKKWFEQFKNK